MLYDRSYMSHDSNTRSQNLLFGLIIFNVVMFAIQLVAGKGYTDLFALSSSARGGPHLWSFFTYSFLHAKGIGHILGNMLGVYFLGRALLPALGEKRFLQLYFGSSVIGGILWFFVHLITGAAIQVVGASGAVYGLIAAFGLIYANQDIHFMMVLRMKGKVLLYISLGISVFGLIFLELLDGSGMAHSAHLGGILGGYLFYKFIYQQNPGYGRNDTFKIPSWLKRKAKQTATKSYPYKVNISSQPRDLKKEIDRILDKINSQGFGSLTAKEKQMLDEAGDLLKKR